jgi:hypothetical protein
MALIWDSRENRKLNKIFLFGALYLLVSSVLRLAVMRNKCLNKFCWMADKLGSLRKCANDSGAIPE